MFRTQSLVQCMIDVVYLRFTEPKNFSKHQKSVFNSSLFASSPLVAFKKFVDLTAKSIKKWDNLFEIDDFCHVIIFLIGLRLVRLKFASFLVSKQTWLSWKIMIFRIVLSLVRFFFHPKNEDLRKFKEKIYHFCGMTFLKNYYIPHCCEFSTLFFAKKTENLR